MAFEAAFGVTAVMLLVVIALYARLRKKHDAVLREKYELAGKTENLPALAKEAASNVTEPLSQIMGELRERMEDLGRQNTGARVTATELVKNTKVIADVLANSHKRGQYSEITIERILQMSGFEKGKHYDTQPSMEDGKADFVVHLPDDRDIILDSKAPLAALQKSAAADDEATRSHYMKEHLSAVRKHIKELSNKKYWKGNKSVLECVIMVVPEYALLPAMEQDEDLIEYAWKHHIVLATQSILMVLLRAVDIIWKQNSMSDAMKEIGKLSADLHGRLVTFEGHYAKTGEVMAKAVEHYNSGVGSWDSRVVPAAEKLAQAGGTIDRLAKGKVVDTVPRKLAGSG